MEFVEFFGSWQFTLLFYAALFYLVYSNKDKFEIQAKIVALYRTKIGLKSMERIAKKFPKSLKALGYIGIVVGYIGMVAICYMLIVGLKDMLLVPDAPPMLAPVLPGVEIPGSPFKIPLISGFLSLFLVIFIHEFSHGVLSKVHGVKVKSSGFLMFGPIPGAFVEPEEKSLKKKKPSVQNSVFAAGPFSNILSAAIVILLMAFAINPLLAKVYEPVGVSFLEVQEGLPASQAGVQTGVVYDTVDGEHIRTTQGFQRQLENLTAGDTVVIANPDMSHTVTAIEHPDRDGGYIGVTLQTRFANENSFTMIIARFIYEFLNLFVILSIGLGLVNLLPIGPVDGGRMFHIASIKYLGKEKGEWLWKKLSVIILLVIIALLYPIIKEIFLEIWHLINLLFSV